MALSKRTRGRALVGAAPGRGLLPGLSGLRV